MVGVGSGAPSAKNGIQLGDVVINKTDGTSRGVIQYNFGKTVQEGRFVRTGSLNQTHLMLRLDMRSSEHNEVYNLPSHPTAGKYIGKLQRLKR